MIVDGAHARHITLHIGTHKTGTTFLQKCLAAQVERLKAQGVYLLSDGPNHSWLYLAFCDHPEIEHEMMKRGLAHSREAATWAEQRRRQFDAELAACPLNHILITGEELCRLPPTGVRRLIAALRAHAERIDVICCVRAPIDYAISDAQESIKGGLTWQSILRSPSLPVYSHALTTYAQVLGRECIKVYPFRKGSPQYLVECFGGVAGIDLTMAEIDSYTNVSLSAEAAYILSTLNDSIPMFLDNGVNPARARIPLPWLEAIGHHPFGLPPAICEAIFVQSTDERAWLEAFTGERWFENERPSDFAWTPLDKGTMRILDGVAAVLHRAAMTIEEAIARVLTQTAEIALEKGETARALTTADQAHRMRPDHSRARELLQILASESSFRTALTP